MNKAEVESLIAVICESRFPESWRSTIPGMHSIRRGAVLTVISAIEVDGTGLARVDMGLAIDVPQTATVPQLTNQLNRQLLLGRVFFNEVLDGAVAAIAMQDIVPTWGIDWAHEASIAHFLNQVASVTAMAENLHRQVLGTCGGRTFGDHEELILFMICDGQE